MHAEFVNDTFWGPAAAGGGAALGKPAELSGAKE